jgi:hydroxymethylglutaryl-CoA reductase
MDRDERFIFLKNFANLSEPEAKLLSDPCSGINFEMVNGMIENAIGTMPLPLGVATGFLINGKDYLVPMATEEPSIVAACSKAAKIARNSGGFRAYANEPIMIGQVQIVSVSFPEAGLKVISNKPKLISIANKSSRTVKATDINVKWIDDQVASGAGRMLIVEIIVDVKDAMGANAINTMCEAISPELERITDGEVVVKVLSNYATRRLVWCNALFRKEDLGGEHIVDRILYSYSFAYSDVYRAVTNNKGIMNGIDALAIAAGQDFRAIEAAAHAYASRDGRYRSITTWKKTDDGDLLGELELPIAVGIVGGVTKVNPLVMLALKILGVKSSSNLAMIISAVGLAQNLSAILALATVGIQKGHMKLHARNIAISAGAQGKLIDIIASKMIREGNVKASRAKEIILSMTGHE